MVISDIDAIRAYLATYQSLEAGRPVWVDMLTPDPSVYSVFSAPGRYKTEFITGDAIVHLPFFFGATETLNEYSTIATLEFYQELSAWLSEQTKAGNLPVLEAGKTALTIEALDVATMVERTENTAVYQLPCQLDYLIKKA